ncbi:sulfate permease II [Martensiomyces pterosporus]|nr:sulfate permease II [Martensiomyces pterosporus]
MSSQRHTYSSTAHEQEPILYVEPMASTRQWVRTNVVPTRSKAKAYLKSLFPISTWIYRYNWTWFLGDLIAGITVGIVVIPQGMAYAKLAQLPPEFGLYSSFIGCAPYFMFATSKDITIGPVAVVSIMMGNILNDVMPQLPEYQDRPWVVASCLSVILGCIVTGLGLLRLGFVVDFIPLPAIAAFMTGSALNIVMGQIPGMLGNNKVKGFNTRDSTYLVFGNFFKHIKECDINAAVGVPSLFLLYFIRWACNYSARRWPQRERLFFFLSTLRTVFVILLVTLISFLVNRNHRDHPKFSILGVVPRGFKHIEVPTVNSTILSALGSKIPSAVIVLIIEHISIAKSFGRVNNYTINPNQEFIAIGLNNIFGPFFGAYPSTGSFSRTAIKSKAGVRTPLAGVITACVVVIAIFALPPAFFYISNALLAAVIIHAVGDLISNPRTIMSFWIVSPFEFFIFWAGVLVSFFSSIDNGIYTTVATSAALMLYRIAKAQGKFLGTIQVYEQKSPSNLHGSRHAENGRNIFIPLDHSDGTNPMIVPKPPPQGIFIYQLSESYMYPNAVNFTDHMVNAIMELTRPGALNPYGSLGNRPWNDPGPRHKTESDIDHSLPELRAVILDFTGVSNVDMTSIQNLSDVRGQLNRHASYPVAWHFAGIRSPWTRRALIASGFGVAAEPPHTVYSVAHVEVSQDKERLLQPLFNEDWTLNGFDDKLGLRSTLSSLAVPLLSVNQPYFHLDLNEALKAAEAELGIH